MGASNAMEFQSVQIFGEDSDDDDALDPIVVEHHALVACSGCVYARQPVLFRVSSAH